MWQWVVTLRVTFVAPVIIASLCAFASGCSNLLDITDITPADGSAERSMSGNNFCNRAFWKATASAGGDVPGPFGGIDGNLATRWSTSREQDGTDWYRVDFGGPVKLTNITLNNSQISPNDYPGGYEVYGSADGTIIETSPFASGSGTPPTTVINFSQRTVRAVKIKQVGTTRKYQWFSIGEFQTTCDL